MGNGFLSKGGRRAGCLFLGLEGQGPVWMKVSFLSVLPWVQFNSEMIIEKIECVSVVKVLSSGVLVREKMR